MKVNGVVIPEHLYYSEEHEWAFREENGLVRVGITDYGQKMLHEVVFVDLPKSTLKVKYMESLGTAESVKAVSEVFSPVSGEVFEGNNDLILTPELVNQDPYGRGWIALITPSNFENEVDHLMKPNEYANYVEKRLKERGKP